MNQVNLIGRVGRDPELRFMGNGKAVCNLSLATSETWKDKDSGEKKESTEWHRLVFFERIAEVAGEYAKKGALISVTGKLKTRKWQDKEGKDNYTTEIHVEQLRLLARAGDGGGGESSGGGQPRQQQQRQQGQQGGGQQSQAKSSGGGFNDMDDDIPF